MNKDIAWYIIQFSWIPYMSTAIYAAWQYRTLPDAIKLFSWFLFLSGTIDIVASILWLNQINNLPLLHFYIVAGFSLLLLFYTKVFSGLISPTIMFVVWIVFVILNILNTVFLQNIYTFNSNGLTVESTLILIISLTAFRFLFHDEIRNHQAQLISPVLWITSGLFVYYSTNLIIFYFGDFFTNHYAVIVNRYTWMLHSFFSMIMYICFFTGLWKIQKN